MHCGLGKVLSLEDETPVPAPLTDSAQLKHFAREAEVNENFELAAKYYQEVRRLTLTVNYTVKCPGVCWCPYILWNS